MFVFGIESTVLLLAVVLLVVVNNGQVSCAFRQK